jgi:hypothetical protein
VVSGAGVRGLLKVLGARARSLLDRIHLIYDGQIGPSQIRLNLRELTLGHRR